MRVVNLALRWSHGNKQAADTCYTLLRSLPARREEEITLLVRFAHEAQDAHLRKAYAQALRYASPHDDHAWTALEQAQTSGIAEIEEAARARLKERPAHGDPQ